MKPPRILDTFCCQGGAAAGYKAAGFEVEGVDLFPQPRFPYRFHQADALKFILEHHREYDAFHASPPCQRHTQAQKIMRNEHPDFIDATRELFQLIGKPWVIENVVGAPLRDPVLLCGSMFEGLATYRHRLFESNFVIPVPEHAPHTAKVTKMGRPPRDGEFMHVVGNFSGVAEARQAMGIDWMTRDGLREAIPPVFAELVGRQMMAVLTGQQVAA